MRWVAALCILLTLALLGGWALPDRPSEPLGVRRGNGPAPTGLMLRPGESTLASVNFLRTLLSDPQPPAPPAPPPVVIIPPPPPPLPPDVAVVFRSALRGIARDPETGELSALIQDPVAFGPQISSRKVGDTFGDGWRISGLTEYAVTLEKGDETRLVRLYG